MKVKIGESSEEMKVMGSFERLIEATGVKICLVLKLKVETKDTRSF
jgi:hypothetical protein